MMMFNDISCGQDYTLILPYPLLSALQLDFGFFEPKFIYKAITANASMIKTDSPLCALISVREDMIDFRARNGD